MTWHDLLTREDHREPRRFDRPWEPKGLICCCTGGGGAGSGIIAYYGSGFAAAIYGLTANAWSGISNSPTSDVSSAFWPLAGIPFKLYGDGHRECVSYTGSWITHATPPLPNRSGPTGAAFNSPSFGYVFCGAIPAGGAPDLATEKYTPLSDTWTTLTNYSLNAGTIFCVANPIGSKAYQSGNAIWSGANFGTSTSHMDEYDPSGDSWAAKTADPTARSSAGGFTVAAASSVMVCGGTFGSTTDYNLAHEYAVDTWTTRSNMPAVGNGCRGAESNAVGFIIGGGTLSTPQSKQTFSWVADTWTTETNAPTSYGSGCCAPN